MLPSKAVDRYSVLVTDDDLAVRQSLRDVFEPQGLRTLLAESGEQAIQIIESDTVHVVMLDMHLPQLTGLETLQIVHQIDATLPCVLISAEADQCLMQRALSAHAFSFLPKPISKAVAIHIVRRALRRFYCV